MTKEEIKDIYNMREIVEKYGFHPNRAGFIQCPFHTGDRTPSLKVYERDFHCHACGKHGDIFTFVQLMEGCSFKEAYSILGGTYETHGFSSKVAIYRQQKRQNMLRKKQEKLKKQKELNHMLIRIYRDYAERSEPFSDVWCGCMNALQYQLYLQSELNGMEARW